MIIEVEINSFHELNSAYQEAITRYIEKKEDSENGFNRWSSELFIESRGCKVEFNGSFNPSSIIAMFDITEI